MAKRGHIFDLHTSFLLLLLTLPLLFLPKINLIGFEGQTAGLRIDDLILLLFGCLIFWGVGSRRFFTPIECSVLAILAWSLLSYISNILLVQIGYLEVRASPFYVGRLFEYFLFFYVGHFLVRFLSIDKVILAFFTWNLLFMALQSLQLLGVFSAEGYLPETGDQRLLGIASFGAEIGLLLNILFCCFLYNQNSKEGIHSEKLEMQPRLLLEVLRLLRPYCLLLGFASLAVFTGARIAIAMVFISFLFWAYPRISWRRPISLLLMIFTLFGTGIVIDGLLKQQPALTERSEGLFSGNNLSLIPLVWESIILDYDPIGRETVTNDDYDASWWMRIHKWCYALKIYWHHPACWLQGVGPGFAMAALDGGYLRILTELGLIALILFGRLFWQMSRSSEQLKWIIVTLCINMLFFDVYLAYKPMSLLFLITGYSQGQACSALFYARGYAKVPGINEPILLNQR